MSMEKILCKTYVSLSLSGDAQASRCERVDAERGHCQFQCFPPSLTLHVHRERFAGYPLADPGPDGEQEAAGNRDTQAKENAHSRSMGSKVAQWVRIMGVVSRRAHAHFLSHTRAQ